MLLDLHNNYGRVGYGIEAYEQRDPQASPGFATATDVQEWVLTVISVNECDPYWDEGINFYRILMGAGVAARCRQVMGTIHGTGILPATCPEISRNTAADIARFCKGVYVYQTWRAAIRRAASKVRVRRWVSRAFRFWYFKDSSFS